MTLETDFKILITAEEAYPELEKAVIDAKSRIDMGFRVFDPRTKVLSGEACEIGETWVELLAHKLAQGVQISISLTDFDPVVRARMHAANWKSFRILMGVGEMSGAPENLSAHVAAHPARVGWVPRLVLWPKVIGQLDETCAWLNALEPDVRRDLLRSMPRLAPMIDDKGSTVRPLRRQVPQMMPVTHHQKLAVIDDRILYVGGLDLDQRRLDNQAHAQNAEQTWHYVHAIVRDPDLARSAREHLDRFEDECAGEVSVRPPQGLLRTLSVRRKRDTRNLSPVVCDTSILDEHLSRISQASDLIYMESQFFRDPVITDALVERAAEAPDLGLMILLPAAPQEIAFDGEEGLDLKYGEYMQAQCLSRLRDAFGDRLFIGSPAKTVEGEGTGRHLLCGAPMIFIHSKVSVFDDTCAIVSSANINGRSMRWDTEVGLSVTQEASVNEVRRRVMGAWVPAQADDAFFTPELGTVRRWNQLAQANASMAPARRRGFILPHDTEAAQEFGQVLPGVPVEMV